MLNENQQIVEQLNRAREILITGKENFTGDSLATMLAWWQLMKKMGKHASIVVSNFELPSQFSFLPHTDIIKPQLYHLKKFTISVDIAKTPIEELAYDKDDQKLSIYLTPKTGTYSERDVRFDSSNYKYDLIVVMDSPDLESLGGIYEHNADFFYHTPIINIDHSPANEYFGQINKVDLTATATSQIVYELIASLGNDLLDGDIATCIYTGMTEKTHSFKTPNVTPHTLQIASRLIQEGADREKIITHLYRTKSIHMLKLWGRALAKLQLEARLKLVWTTLTQTDFDKSGSNETYLQSLVDEIISETPQAEVIVVFVEKQNGLTEIHVYTTHKVNALSLIRHLNPNGNKQYARADVADIRVAEAERDTIAAIKAELEKTYT